jgi:hypothetical protein
MVRNPALTKGMVGEQSRLVLLHTDSWVPVAMTTTPAEQRGRKPRRKASHPIEGIAGWGSEQSELCSNNFYFISYCFMYTPKEGPPLLGLIYLFLYIALAHENEGIKNCKHIFSCYVR